jgi:hypothetical protein
MASPAWLFPDDDLQHIYSTDSYKNCPYSPGRLVQILQNAIRCNQPPIAHEAAARLLASMQSHMLMEQLVILAAGEVGLGNLEALQLCVRSMQHHNKFYRTMKDKTIQVGPNVETMQWRRDLRNLHPLRQMIALCVETLCLSPKSREAVHAAVVFFSKPNQKIPHFVWAMGATLGEEEALFQAFAVALGSRYDAKILHEMYNRFPASPILRSLYDGMRLLNPMQGEPWKGKYLLALTVMFLTRPDTCYNLAVQVPLSQDRIFTQISQNLYAQLIHAQLPLPPTPPCFQSIHQALKVAERLRQPRFHAAEDNYFPRALLLAQQQQQQQQQ